MVDVVFSPAGDMYALEYGTNWFSQNMDARLIHLTYSSANRVPVAAVSADKTVGKTPLTVTFNSDATTDPDGDEITYEWNFGDGETSTEKSPAHEFKKAGEYKVSFSVTDPSGEKASQELLIIAGNDLPELKINFSGNSRFYWNNSTFDYSIEVTDSEDGSVGNGIDAKAITFTADYLAHGKDVTEIIQGHQANMEASANLVGKTLYENSDCRSCHHATEKSVGPAMKQISDKYADNEGAVKMLVDKVIKGGSGVWGDLMMAPHPQLSVDDTEKMIRYMLSIGNKTPQSGLPNKGVYALNKHKPTEKEGTYIFTASYTDRGGNGIKPLTATKVIVLSYPFLGADQYSEKKKAQTFKITKDIYPAIEEETTIVLPNHEGSLRYKGIDFTGVGVIKIGAAVAPNYFSGGTLDIFIDGETGQKIGSAKLEIGLTDLGFKELLVPISEVKGLHDLIIKVNCTDPSKVFGGIATLEFVKK